MNVKVYTTSPLNNYISHNKFGFFEIPGISIYKFFWESSENLYFIALALFQLLTYESIGILPENWSPCGPFSTLIPLLCCYLLEITQLVVTYFRDLYKTYKYNYCKYVYVLDNCSIKKVPIKDICINDLIVINTDEIIPVDSLLVMVDGRDYANISLSNLNGECDIICKDIITKGYSNIYNISISIDNIQVFSNSVKQFKARCLINNTETSLNNNHFIPGGAINKGECCVVVVTQIGKSIRSYTSNKNEKLFKPNFIDNYITQSLTNYFIPILAIFTLCLTMFKNYNNNILEIVKTFIQSWILLNGVVPFSAKIIVMINRSIQSYIKSTKQIEYVNSNSIDNFHEINRIICDKTGTITKNELLLTHISFNGLVYMYKNSTSVPFTLLYKVVLSLHYKHNTYATEEDKIISDKIISLGTIIETTDSHVNIATINDKANVEIIEMNKLEFDCNRKMSSVIYKESGKYYIITKGSIDSIKNILHNTSIEKFKKEAYLYDYTYPYLRTIAIAIKEIDYNHESDPLLYECHQDYNFLTILGIEDELQDNITDTIEHLTYNKKQISICTGDRYETAIYITNSLKLMRKIITVKSDIVNINLGEYTFIFTSKDILCAKKHITFMEKFTFILLNTYNFVGYSMIPRDKQFVSNIFEMNKINVIAVGDGNNDIPMLKSSTIGIGVKNGLNTNVINNSQITIESFSDLTKVNSDSSFCYMHNYNSIYSVFYKIVLIHSLIFLFMIENNYNLNNILFNLIEIQGNHLIWGVLPIIAANIAWRNIILVDISLIIKISIIAALLNAKLIMELKNYEMFDLSIKARILTLLIISLNMKFILIFGVNYINIISCLFSVILGFIYIIYF